LNKEKGAAPKNKPQIQINPTINSSAPPRTGNALDLSSPTTPIGIHALSPTNNEIGL